VFFREDRISRGRVVKLLKLIKSLGDGIIAPRP
jgi:hypothetical protein